MCSKCFIHDFQIVLSNHFKTESELYKKYEKQPESKIYKQVVNIYEYVEQFFEQFSVGLSSPSIKMVFCTELKENGFAKSVDSNRHLIGFSDCVYDLDRYEIRPFNLNNAVPLSTGYDFQLGTKYDQEIETFFKQVFPDADVREFMKKFLASCCAGCSEHEILCFWTGANEGKRTGVMENLHCVLLWLRHLVIIILREHLVLLQENVKNQRVQILKLNHLKTSDSYHFKRLILMIVSTCLFSKD